MKAEKINISDACFFVYEHIGKAGTKNLFANFCQQAEKVPLADVPRAAGHKREKDYGQNL